MKKNIDNIFNDVTDPRVVGRCTHKLSDILFIALCTLLCNGEDFEDMVEFGLQRYDWLKTILDLPKGIPSHDTFNRVLQKLNPTVLSKILESDGRLILDTVREKQICIDGKKIRGVSPRLKKNEGLYILSAWVSENNICIGQQKVEDKSNEMTAIPELINSLDIEGSVISIDAMGCQKIIADKIIEKKGDYFLALKKNQKGTYQLVEEAFMFHDAENKHTKEDKDHGRVEKRKCSIIDVNKLPNEETPVGWKNLSTIVKVEAIRIIKDKIQKEIRYYLSSEKYLESDYFNSLTRGHWSIENQLHWHLDVTFREDKSRARTGYSQQNLNILRKIALQKISQMNDKLSKKKRRYRASLNNNYLKEVIQI